MKCEEVEEELEFKLVEKFYQFSCFIEKGQVFLCQGENFKYMDISMKYRILMKNEKMKIF